MPVGAIMLAKTEQPLSEQERNAVRNVLLDDFGADSFRGSPNEEYPEDLWPMADYDGSKEDYPICTSPQEKWYDLNLAKRYFGKGHVSGTPDFFVSIANRLEELVSGIEIWYGNDACDETILPFSAEARDALLKLSTQD